MTNPGLQPIIQDVKTKLSLFMTKTVSLSGYQKELNTLKMMTQLRSRVDQSSGKSWLLDDFDYYYKDFQSAPERETLNTEWRTPSNNWKRRSFSEVSTFIESEAKTTPLANISEDIGSIAIEAYDMKDGICTELSILNSYQEYEHELELIKVLDNLSWTLSLDKFIAPMRPTLIRSLDPERLSRGTTPPHHLNYHAHVKMLLETINYIETIQRMSLRIVRQVELKAVGVEGMQPAAVGISEIMNLCNRFGEVARQLVVRHNHRDSIVIIDEYDVQDLFHALLRIYFDDIRPEEYSPSYAGDKGSRMDFILKPQKTVVEIKKTRDTMTERELGSQLIVDIQKYRQHPDCQTLICFVYDPERRINNPRGIENDLSGQREGLNVIALIRPL